MMRFISKQWVGFYGSVVAAVLMIVGLALVAANGNTVYYNDVASLGGIIAAIVFAIVFTVAAVVVSETALGKNRYASLAADVPDLPQRARGVVRLYIRLQHRAGQRDRVHCGWSGDLRHSALRGDVDNRRSVRGVRRDPPLARQGGEKGGSGLKNCAQGAGRLCRPACCPRGNGRSRSGSRRVFAPLPARF